MKDIAVYRWGVKSSNTNHEDDPIKEDIESGELMKLGPNHMGTMNIKEEDEDRVFYAYPSDMDIDEDGIAIKYAYGVKESDL